MKRKNLETPDDFELMILESIMAKLDAKGLDTSTLREHLAKGWYLAAVSEMAKVMNHAPKGFLIEFRSYKQRKNREGKEAAWKPKVRDVVSAIDTRELDSVLSSMEGKTDFDLNRVDETVSYTARNGNLKYISFQTVKDFLSRPTQNNLKK